MTIVFVSIVIKLILFLFLFRTTDHYYKQNIAPADARAAIVLRKQVVRLANNINYYYCLLFILIKFNFFF